MRISTQTFYDQSKSAMNSLQTNVMRTQQQMAAGTKILAPSDDPLGATRALAVSQSIALNEQYAASRSHTSQSLTMQENALQSVTTVLQNVKEIIIQAGGILTDADRSTLATALQSNMDQLQGLANSDDGNGQFLFAGFKSGSAPFVSDANGGVSYVGDQGKRLSQVDVSRQMANADDGRSIFQSVQTGSGYVTSAAGNTGSGIFGAVAVTNSSSVDYGKDFSISFPTATTYLVDTEPASLAPTPQPFTPGRPIDFGGLQIIVTGSPAANDKFSVIAAKNAGTDIFSAIKDVINALNTPVQNAGAAGQALTLNALSTANRKVTNAHDNVLTVRSSVGSRLQELDALGVKGDSRTLSDKSQLSNLQDLDYGTTIAEFYQRQTALQASQQTFVKIQQIALFNYL